MAAQADGRPFDAVMVVSFGGPEGPDEVMPFLENVVRGRGIPRSRLEAVAEHYHRFGGVSPINGQNRALVAALEKEFESTGLELPVYWGNRNWHPFITDELRRMRGDGVRRALAFVTSAFGSYSSCRQYREDLDEARAAVGKGAPAVEKLRLFFNHPGFVDCWVDSVRVARATAGAVAPVLFSAHSIPLAMARSSPYEEQLAETARLVAAGAGLTAGRGDGAPTLRRSPGLGPRAGKASIAAGDWRLVWQSRTGPPGQPWLEPDIGDAVAELGGQAPAVVVAPIGFVSDHMEVVYDLDTVVAERAASAGVRLVRAATPGTDQRFVSMIRQLVEERVRPGTPRLAVGTLPAPADQCPADCCPGPPRPAPGSPRPGV